MFEIYEREQTTLLNQISELIFAVSGGGFQYFYNDRDRILRKVNQPEFILEQLELLCKSGKFYGYYKDLESFIDLLPSKEIVKLIWKFYKEDWDKYYSFFNHLAPIVEIFNTKVFFIVGYDLKLMPMIGSVQLNQISKRLRKKKAILLMLNITDSKIHLSLRGTERSQIDCGKLAYNLSLYLKENYNIKKVSGGGHPVAAEMVVSGRGVQGHIVISSLMHLLEKL